MNCVFCAIAAGELPAELLYEDEHCLVLMDIYPLRPGHVLVVSREHYPYLHLAPEAVREAMFALSQRVMQAQRKLGWGQQGINWLLNDGPAANQHVPHCHMHQIAREPGDTLALLWRTVVRFVPVGRAKVMADVRLRAAQLRGALNG